MRDISYFNWAQDLLSLIGFYDNLRGCEGCYLHGLVKDSSNSLFHLSLRQTFSLDKHFENLYILFLKNKLKTLKLSNTVTNRHCDEE